MLWQRLIGQKKNSNLPSTYQELDFIEGTGTQYIDTGITCGYGRYKFDITCTMTTITSASQTFIGAYNADNYRGQYPVCKRVDKTVWAMRNDRTWYDSIIKIVTGKETRIRFDGVLTTYKINDYLALSSFNVVSQEVPYNFFLFALNNTGTPQQFWQGRLYECKIYNASDTLIFDGKPCYRFSDKQTGIYNILDNTFHPNLSTDPFLIGHDIN